MSKRQSKDYLLWSIGNIGAWRCTILPQRCSMCKRKNTLVGLPPPLLAKQPDETNVVCHPGLKGCNHGFYLEIPRGVSLCRALLTTGSKP